MTPILYAVDVTALSDASLYEAAYRSVSESRRQKTDRLRFPEDRFRSLGAELLLRHALRSAGERTMPETFTVGEYGKPSIPGAVHFNLSHSGAWALCAVAEAEVGCDVEKIAAADDALVARCLTPQEASLVRAQGSKAERDLLFFRLWTLKESLMKATGRGLGLAPGTIALRLGERVFWEADSRYAFTEFELPGYCLALCVEGDRRRAEFTVTDLHDLLSEAHADVPVTGKA